MTGVLTDEAPLMLELESRAFTTLHYSTPATDTRPTMYAITFDMDTKALEAALGSTNYKNAYAMIAKELEARDFEWTQGSVYFGRETVDAVSCVLAVQDIARKFNWFQGCVRDIRMLRIEEKNDLKPAIDSAMAPAPKPSRKK